MNTKSGTTRTIKAALMLLVMWVLTSQMGYSQLIGFNGRLPKKNVIKTKYKCKHVGVQKVKHAKVKISAKGEMAKLVLVVKPEHTITSSLEVIPVNLVEPVMTVVEESPKVIDEKSTEQQLKLFPQAVFFRYDSYRLDIIDLTQIALAVNLVKEGHSITIIGHTDNWGSEQYNTVLSQKRAGIIKDMMVKLGCDPTKITAVGEGEKFPIDSNDHEVGRQNNRRVEFVIN